MSLPREELRLRLEGLGLLKAGREVPLHLGCPNANRCWTGLSVETHAPVGEVAGVSLPWIGPRYESGGVLLVGINFVEFGGIDAWDTLISTAIDQLPTRDRLFAQKGYGGSMLQQRGGWYAAIVLRHLKVAGFDDGTDIGTWNRRPTRNRQVIEAWRHLAAVNQVICSPNRSDLTPNSRPTSEMWEHCSPFLMRHELEVLRPRVLLILGLGETLRGLDALGRVRTSIVRPGVRRGVLESPEGAIQIVVLPHPAARGGTSRAHITHLDEALSEQPL